MGNSAILLGLHQGGGGELPFCSWGNKDLINRKMMELIRFHSFHTMHFKLYFFVCRTYGKYCLLLFYFKKLL